MKITTKTLFWVAALECALLFQTGCSSVSTYTRAYLTSPAFPPSNAASVQILQAEPKRPYDKLGEVMVAADGEPSREKVEQKLRKAAAKLGADAVFITADKLSITPIVYMDWWGPATTGQDVRRNVVAVAVKFK